jgi:hypothetical protein
MMNHSADVPLETIDFAWLARKANVHLYEVDTEFKYLKDFYCNLSIEEWKCPEERTPHYHPISPIII